MIYDLTKLLYFWQNVLKSNQFPTLIISKLMCLLGSTYLCKSTFNIAHFLKNKFRSRITQINLESELKCALTSFEPNFEAIATKDSLNPL